ncbi:SH3 domain-containing protein [Salmonella enterica]
MTAALRFAATDSHISEYPDPMSFICGTSVIIHEKYEGEEGWDNWYYCTIPGHTGGLVPGQILERCEGTYRGIARQDYNAR